jgi:hypothetical protein
MLPSMVNYIIEDLNKSREVVAIAIDDDGDIDLSAIGLFGPEPMQGDDHPIDIKDGAA